MIRRLAPTDYYDAPYGRGVHLVLLHGTGDLYRRARGPFSRIAAVRPSTNCWECLIDSTEAAEAVQACWVPQYRIIINGSERFQHVGCLGDDELAAALDQQDD